VQGVSFSPDGSRLASASEDKTVRLWDAATGKELGVLKGHTGVVHHVCFSADGNRLASSGQDLVVRVWDVASRKQVLVLKGHRASVTGVSFSPDGRRLVSMAQDQTIRVWDADAGTEVFSLRHHTNTGWGVAFSADGRLLASPEDERVHLWDAATGKELRSLKGHTKRVYRLDFSPDSQRLASASEDGTVRLWATATGRELLTLKGHNETVYSVSFSSDGRRLAACGSEGTVRVWEAAPVPDAVWRRRGLAVRVDLLFQELLFRQEVLAALGKDSRFEEDDRQFALQLAQAHQDDPEDWNSRAWDLAKVRDGNKDGYTRAMRLAEAAVRLAPKEGNYLNTLGVVQYRLGRYDVALATLRKSQKLNESPRPDDLAFLAMTQHQLGKKDEAKATFNRLREVIKQSPYTEDAEAADFLEEAKELIEGKTSGRRKLKPDN
jgi:dipeptidyl aminopeptidase/acylaminoacyl peptidase